MVKVFTYYTVNTPYEDEVKNLLKSADEHGVAIEAIGFKTAGRWLANSSMKYVFMRDLLKENDVVVALDADAVIKKYPSLILDDGLLYQYPAGVAAYVFRPPGIDPDLCDGTLYMTKDALPIVEEVIVRCNRQPEIFDQRHLYNVLKEQKKALYELPYAYCAMLSFDSIGGVTEDQVVIRHNQASRRFRSNTDKGLYNYVKVLQERL